MPIHCHSITIMGFCHISWDVKIAAIRLYEQDLLHSCGFSLSTFYCVLKLWHETGDVIKPSTKLHGQPCILDHDDLQYLLCLVHDNPDYFLNELLHLFKTNQFISVHYTSIHHMLECVDISPKKIKWIAAKRNKAHCAAFVARMAQHTSEQLGFLDETSKINERTSGWWYGQSKKEPSVTGVSPLLPFSYS